MASNVALAPATKVHVAFLKLRVANSIPTRTSLAVCSLVLRLPGNCHLRQVYLPMQPRTIFDLPTFVALFRGSFELQIKGRGLLTQSTTTADLTAQLERFHQASMKSCTPRAETTPTGWFKFAVIFDSRSGCDTALASFAREIPCMAVRLWVTLGPAKP